MQTPDLVHTGDPKPFIGASCGLPDCGEQLYMTKHFTRAIYLDDSAETLASTDDSHTTSWDVECGNGHKVLLPPATAEDYYTFGHCKCEPTDPSADADCGHGDMARLRKIIGMKQITS